MEHAQRNILKLIKASFTGVGTALDPDFSLEEQLPLIQEHQIDGMIYQGALLCGIPKNAPAMKSLFSRYYQHILIDQRQRALLDQLTDRFQTLGLDYLPLKGTVLKGIYPEPAMRPMGDADILIRMEQYDAVRTVLLELGFEEGHTWNHEIVWKHKDLYLELHSRLVNKWPPNYFGTGWQRAVSEQGHRYGFSPEDTYLFLFAHYGKHYRAGGIGLRQLTDLWVWKLAKPDMDMAYMRREMESINLLQFFDHTQKMLSSWFEDGPEDAYTKHMTDYIFASGCWGYVDNRLASRAAGQMKEGQKSGSRLRLILRTVFPPLEVMNQRYPVLKKCPVLLPLFWVVRIIGGVLFRRRNVKACMDQTSQSMVKKAESFEEALIFVGLEPSSN